MATIKTSDVVFRQDLYPRIKHDPVLVQKYADAVEHLPPIEVNQHNELIDGWHRWTAHKQLGLDSIQVTVTKTSSDANLLELAIDRNAKHGMQLSMDDKRRMALQIYSQTPVGDRKEKLDWLVKVLAVGQGTLRGWVADIDRTQREEAKSKARDLWLLCNTLDEIASVVGEKSPQTISNWIDDFSIFDKSSKNGKVANFDDDYKPPIYNVWTKAAKSNEVDHFGNTEASFTENLLYLYTNPGDVVVDPFAGGGATIDVCLRRSRRVFASDRKPIEARKHEIREHDITNGLPPLHKGLWPNTKLVYLDPPYWRQAFEKYSKDKTDLANVDADTFHDTLAKLVNDFSKKLPQGARIALIIQPTQWNAPNREPVDHVIEIVRRVKLPIDIRIQAPYPTEQYNAQQVIWAKEQKKLLVISREIVVWRCG